MNDPSPEVPPLHVEPSAAAVPVDWKKALGTVAQNRKLLCDLVAIFLTEHPRLVQNVEQAVQRREPKELKLAAHALKGSVRYFGSTRATEAASRLEIAGGRGQADVDPRDVAELKAALDELTQYLRTTEVPYPDASAEGNRDLV